MFCEHCGADNKIDASVCFACQHPLDPLPDLTTTPLSKSSDILKPNVLLKGRYCIIKCIGQGGFGSVYKARDVQVNNRVVAVKEIDMGSLKPQEIIEATDAFNREVQVLSELKHISLPKLYNHFTDAEHWYMVMDFIEGETLETYIEQATHGSTQTRGIFMPDVIDIALQLCAVLDHMHHHNPPIIFRDLKPANVMLAPSKRVFLIDFGIARHFKPGQIKDTMAFGSPGYASPEQYGKAQTTPRSDIYSLGAIMHQMLTGKDPSESPFHFTSILAYDKALPAALNWLLIRMLDVDPYMRPASMEEVRDELLRIMRVSTNVQGQHAHAQNTHSYGAYQAQFPPLPPLNPVYNNGPASLPPVQPPPMYTSPGGQVQAMYQPQQAIQPAPSAIYGKAGSGGNMQTVYYPQQAASAQSTPQTPKKLITRRNVFTTLGIIGGVLWLGGNIFPHGSSTTQPDTSNSAAPPTPGPKVSLSSASLYQGHTAAINAVAWNDVNTILSASADATVRLWNINMAIETLIYRKHKQAVTAVALPNIQPITSDGVTLSVIASGSLDKTVHIWDRYAGQLQQVISCSAAVNAISWSPDGTRIAIGCADGRAYLYQFTANKWQLLKAYQAHQKSIRVLAWSSNGSYIATASEDSTVQVWESDATHVLTYHGHVGTVDSLAWSPNSNTIASASSDRTVQVWDALSGSINFTYTGHITHDSLDKLDQSPPAIVTSVIWEPQGTYIASATSDGTIHIWDATNGTFITEQKPDKPAAIRAMAWSSDNYNIVTGGDDHIAQRFSVSIS